MRFLPIYLVHTRFTALAVLSIYQMMYHFLQMPPEKGVGFSPLWSQALHIPLYTASILDKIEGAPHTSTSEEKVENMWV